MTTVILKLADYRAKRAPRVWKRPEPTGAVLFKLSTATPPRR